MISSLAQINTHQHLLNLLALLCIELIRRACRHPDASRAEDGLLGHSHVHCAIYSGNRNRRVEECRPNFAVPDERASAGPPGRCDTQVCAQPTTPIIPRVSSRLLVISRRLQHTDPARACEQLRWG